LLYALAIWIVDKLGLGLKVSGFVPALIAAAGQAEQLKM